LVAVEYIRKRFFLKKEAKTFASWHTLRLGQHVESKKFFGSFLQKRTAFLFTFTSISNANVGASTFRGGALERFTALYVHTIRELLLIIP
jgi:hypothetical protein